VPAEKSPPATFPNPYNPPDTELPHHLPLQLEQARLAASLPSLACSALTVQLQSSPEQLVVSGLIGDGPSLDALGAMTHQIPTFGLRYAITQFPASPLFCRAAEIARSAASDRPGAPLVLALQGGATRLLTDDPITLVIRMPDFDGEIRIDYLTGGGATLLHVEPTAGMPPRYSANAEVRLGPNHDGNIGTVSEPYGTDLILAVASSQPLLAPRPNQEDAATYLSRLQAAVDAVRRQGGQVSVGLLALETAKK
jgi:hypothetical protein